MGAAFLVVWRCTYLKYGILGGMSSPATAIPIPIDFVGSSLASLQRESPIADTYQSRRRLSDVDAGCYAPRGLNSRKRPLIYSFFSQKKRLAGTFMRVHPTLPLGRGIINADFYYRILQQKQWQCSTKASLSGYFAAYSPSSIPTSHLLSRKSTR